MAAFHRSHDHTAKVAVPEKEIFINSRTDFLALKCVLHLLPMNRIGAEIFSSENLLYQLRRLLISDMILSPMIIPTKNERHYSLGVTPTAQVARKL